MKIPFDLKNDRQLQLALGATIVLAIVLLGYYVSNLVFAERGMERYLVGGFVGLGLLFWGLKTFRVLILAPAILIFLLSFLMMILKFDWRKEYIQSAEAGEPFLFEQYVDHYPTLEEYFQARMFGGQDWVGFARECGEPAKRREPVPQQCKTLQDIRDTYGLNVQQVMDNHFAKMKKTARLIADGKMTNKRIYERCVAQKNCAIVPLLPANVENNEMIAQSTDYMDLRQAFWSLVEDENLSRSVCDYMGLCNLLVRMGAINMNRFGDSAATVNGTEAISSGGNQASTTSQQ
tara:strand:- start:1987 stop:2859 length:873 start_codon:yes stop_codon:yes gene_type:complete